MPITVAEAVLGGKCRSLFYEQEGGPRIPYDLGANLIPGVMQSGVAVYDIGGWFDGFCRATFKLYATMKDTNPSKIIVDPSYHVPMRQGFADYLGVDLQDLAETAGWLAAFSCQISRKRASRGAESAGVSSKPYAREKRIRYASCMSSPAAPS